MTVFRTVKQCLLHYPTLFRSRADVLEHLFAVIGNGYEWHKGELVMRKYRGMPKKPKGMNYSDLEENKKKYDLKNKTLRNLYLAWMINDRFEWNRRMFTETNIKLIASNINVNLEGSHTGLKSSYYIDNPCTDYAKLFNAPDDITKDWGLAALEFVALWRQYFYTKWAGFYHPKDSEGNQKQMVGEELQDYNYCEKLNKVEDRIRSLIGLPSRETSDKKASEIIDKALEKL